MRKIDKKYLKLGQNGYLGPLGVTLGAHLGPKWKKVKKRGGKLGLVSSMLSRFLYFRKKCWTSCFSAFVVTLQDGTFGDFGGKKASKRRLKVDMFDIFWGM